MVAVWSLCCESRIGWDCGSSASLTKKMSIFMGLAVVLGGVVYDERIYHIVTSALGLSDVPHSLIIRVPVFFCLLEGIAALLVALKMQEVDPHTSIDSLEKPSERKKASFADMLKQTLAASGWVLRSRSLLALIIGVMLVDAVVRNFATLTSTYYRYILLPEYSYGLIGAAFAIVGIFMPYILKPMVRNYGVLTNMIIVSAFALAGLFGIAVLPGYWGVIPAMFIMLTLKMLAFVASRFLNQFTSSDMRATVLSVKGLFLNLGYAVFSFMFAQTLAYRTSFYQESDHTLTHYQAAKNLAFADVLLWTPILLAVFLLMYFVIFYRFSKMNTAHKNTRLPGELT